MAGIAIIAMMPMMTTTMMISSSVNPREPDPRRRAGEAAASGRKAPPAAACFAESVEVADVSAVTVTTRPAVGAHAENFVVVTALRAAILVFVVPGVLRHLLQVRPVPHFHSGWRGQQRVEPFLLGRIATGIERHRIERRGDVRDLQLGGLDAGLGALPEEVRRNEGREQPEDHHHDEQLDHREARLPAPPVVVVSVVVLLVVGVSIGHVFSCAGRRLSLSGVSECRRACADGVHLMASLTLNTAETIAQTMNPVTAPMTTSTSGLISAIVRAIAWLTSLS